jgi:hypothetical protein
MWASAEDFLPGMGMVCRRFRQMITFAAMTNYESIILKINFTNPFKS